MPACCRPGRSPRASARPDLRMAGPLSPHHSLHRPIGCRRTENLPRAAADPRLLRRAVINLLDNALAAVSPKGTVLVSWFRNRPLGEELVSPLRTTVPVSILPSAPVFMSRGPRPGRAEWTGTAHRPAGGRGAGWNPSKWKQRREKEPVLRSFSRWRDLPASGTISLFVEEQRWRRDFGCGPSGFGVLGGLLGLIAASCGAADSKSSASKSEPVPQKGERWWWPSGPSRIR